MLEGISRKTVIEICDELGIPCATNINKDEFLSANEVFIATTAGGPVPLHMRMKIFSVMIRYHCKDFTNLLGLHMRKDLSLKVCYNMR